MRSIAPTGVNVAPNPLVEPLRRDGGAAHERLVHVTGGKGQRLVRQQCFQRESVLDHKQWRSIPHRRDLAAAPRKR